MSHLGELVGTQAATAEPGDSCLRFTSMLKLDDLHSDFRINIEIYSFQTQPKYLPHEKKYHISHNVKVSVKAKYVSYILGNKCTTNNNYRIYIQWLNF